jgi:transcriptional regulator with XRE-family HTH domain
MAKPRSEIVGTEAIRLLREKREALGLSMNGVAADAGLSHTMISRVERGLRQPTLDTVLRIAGAIGVEFWPLLRTAEATSPLAKARRKQ